jgi:hypothetical protein
MAAKGQFSLLRRPGRIPLSSDGPPSRQRRFRPPSAFGTVVILIALAMVVAFVATLVYAAVDAGRPIAGGPTTIPGSANTTPTLVIAEPQVTTTEPPKDLPPDELAKKLAASVRTVNTMDEAGQPLEGTAFVVGAFGGQTLLLTSLGLVRAGTRAPAPPITVGDNRQATLWTWQEDRDLALLTIPGTIESLPWVNAATPPKAGERLFSSTGDRLLTGMILGVSLTGIDHNIFVEDKVQGAPLVNQKGEVLAMASRVYDPDGKGTETLFTGVPINLACDQVLRCGGGNTAPTTSTTRP